MKGFPTDRSKKAPKLFLPRDVIEMRSENTEKRKWGKSKYRKNEKIVENITPLSDSENWGAGSLFFPFIPVMWWSWTRTKNRFFYAKSGGSPCKGLLGEEKDYRWTIERL